MIDLTDRDLDILETLTRRVRLLSIDQVRCIWWPAQKVCRNARRRLRQLAYSGFVDRRIVNVQRSHEVREPLATWQPGTETPDLLAVSRAARNRWQGIAVPTELFTATHRTANLFGSTTIGLPNLFHRDRTLVLSEVYALYRTKWPQRAKRWLDEDAPRGGEYRIKAFDAFLINDCGRPSCAIKSAGRYAMRQIEVFHQYCDDYNLSYELW